MPEDSENSVKSAKSVKSVKFEEKDIMGNRSRNGVNISEISEISEIGEMKGNKGEEWVLNGRKWWTTGACDPRCGCCIFVALTGGKNDPAHRRHSLFLFPLHSEGVTVVRPLYVMGYDDAPHGHAEVSFKNVLVASSDVLGGFGMGFEVAQSRLGPGRLHHCSRLVGHGERAIQEILHRGTNRTAFGKPLLDLGGNSEKLANCRILLRLAKLSLLEAAVELDRATSSHAVRLPDSALQALAVTKVATPRAVQECLDFAIQIHGGGSFVSYLDALYPPYYPPSFLQMSGYLSPSLPLSHPLSLPPSLPYLLGGLSADHPLAAMWAAARTLRLVDGPDEVHLRTLTKIERANHPVSTVVKSKFTPGTGKSRL